MSRGRLQDLRGAPEEDESKHPLHHLRHLAAFRLHRPIGRPQLPGLPEINKHLCSLQQVLDQGKNLRATQTTGILEIVELDRF